MALMLSSVTDKKIARCQRGRSVKTKPGGGLQRMPVERLAANSVTRDRSVSDHA